MKIILNSKEADLLTKYLNSDIKIKTINFEESGIYINALAQLIVEQLSNLNARRGYVVKKHQLFFLNDFDPFLMKFHEKLYKRRANK